MQTKLEELNTTIGLVLKELRLNSEYSSLSQFAMANNKSKSSISDFENGVNSIRFSTLDFYCDVFKITYADFFKSLEARLNYNFDKYHNNIDGDVFERISYVIENSNKKSVTIANELMIAESTVLQIKKNKKHVSVPMFILILTNLNIQPSSILQGL